MTFTEHENAVDKTAVINRTFYRLQQEWWNEQKNLPDPSYEQSRTPVQRADDFHGCVPQCRGREIPRPAIETKEVLMMSSFWKQYREKKQMNINKGRKTRPRRTLLYGVHGVGKSQWAASAPGVCFLNFEDGLDDIDCASSDLITTHEGLMEALRYFSDAKHDFRYLAIDTVDWLEKIIHKEIAKEAGKNSIADIGYGAGYKQAMAKWDKVFFALEWLRKEIGMGIILLAHCDIKRFESPEQESYDRYQPALHPLAAAALQEWCDEVLFASYRVFTRKEDQGFNKERNIAIGDGERYIRTQETPAVLAKNRLDLPPELPMPKENGFAVYAQYFPGSGAGDIDGVVVDGSSKQK